MTRTRSRRLRCIDAVVVVQASQPAREGRGAVLVAPTFLSVVAQAFLPVLPLGRVDRQECLSHHRQECLCHQREPKATAGQAGKPAPQWSRRGTAEIELILSVVVLLTVMF